MSALAYASVADMVARFGEEELVQLTDLETPPEAVNRSRVAVALRDAQGFCDAYLAQRYVLPLSGCADPNGGSSKTPPPLLQRIVCDVARFFLYDDLAPEHEVARRYHAQIKLLEAIASGAVSLGCPLGDAVGEEVTGSSAGETEHGFAPRQVTDDSLRGFL
jgi:phage gp36-like protein